MEQRIYRIEAGSARRGAQEKSFSGKKCVVSTTGNISLSGERKKPNHQTERKLPPLSARPKKVVEYVRGERICTIALYYCTARGLVLNGILDPPTEVIETPAARRKKRARTSNPAVLTPDFAVTNLETGETEILLDASEDASPSLEIIDLT